MSLKLTCRAVVIWQGFNKYISCLDANLKPNSIPNTMETMTNKRRLPPRSFLRAKKVDIDTEFVMRVKTLSSIKTIYLIPINQHFLVTKLK